MVHKFQKMETLQDQVESHLLEGKNFEIGSESDDCIIVRSGTDDIPVRD